VYMDRPELQAALDSAGFSHLAKEIDGLALWSIRLTSTSVDGASLPVGASRLGGVPDLPADLAWPEWKGLPQSFVAQLRLDDLHAYDKDNLLPSKGMLWFFYDAKQETYGEDPKDAGGWRVFFKEDTSTLRRVAFPAKLPKHSRFHTCSLAFSSELTLPLEPQLVISGLEWTDDDQEKYDAFLSTYPSADDHTQVHNRVLGHSNTLQDDMRQQCQLLSNGVTDPDDPKAQALMAGATEWHLLLQVDSDKNADMQWASTGMLYYWIKKADLQAGHFDGTWLVLQSE
jgi:uncharacterized protein YwqG